MTAPDDDTTTGGAQQGPEEGAAQAHAPASADPVPAATPPGASEGAPAVAAESEPGTAAGSEPVDPAVVEDGSEGDAADTHVEGGSGTGERDRVRLALLASAVGLVLLLAAALFLGFQLRSAAQDDAARRDALAAARQSALNLTSIDKDNFADDVASVLDGATGEFRSDFAARAGELERLLTENEVVAEGQVLDAGIVRADRRSATALVVVDSTVSNTQTPDGRVNSYRMKLELEKVGDRWLTSVLEFVG